MIPKWLTVRSWMPNLFDRRIWLPVIPLILAFTVFWVVAFDSFQLIVKTIKFWEYLCYGFAQALVGYWILLAALIRYARSTWIAIIAAWFYLILYAINSALLYHSATLLQPYYLQMLGWTNWMIYLTKWVYILIGLFVGICAWAALSIHRNAPALSQLRLRGLAVALVVLWILPTLQARGIFRPTYLMVNLSGAQHAGAWQEGQTEQLRSLARNPIKILAQAIFGPKEILARRPTTDLAQFTGALKNWGLPMGPREYPSLGLLPFDQIVVFATESLSLDFLAPYNSSLARDLTPFYGSAEISASLLTNYWTTALPTQYGLLVTYNSHPNAAGLMAGDSDLSIVKLLSERGYHTLFLKSDSETFINDRSIFSKIGFQEISGLETWLKDPKKKPFIEGRGMMDRALYETVLDTMEKYRGQKVLIHVCGQDTHSPNPRDNYGALEYPSTPKDIESIPTPEAREVMKGVFRHDYDIGRIIQAMRDRHLLTDRTLVVLTADHNYPQSAFLQAIPGFPRSYYTRIPLCFISGQPLPKINAGQLHTQLDFAPTLAHLLGLPVPQGWWGQSVFLTNPPPPHLARIQENLVIEQDGKSETVSLSMPRGEQEQELVGLFGSVFCETNSLKR
jgi:hypothetical protein